MCGRGIIFLANKLEEAGDKAGAHYWRLQAAEGGQPHLWYQVGRSFYDGKDVKEDIPKAYECFNKAIAEDNDPDAYNIMGACIFTGYQIPQDHARAFEYFSTALKLKESTFGYPYLAQCFLEGWGTAPDYQQAYKLAWDTKEKPRSLYVLGRIYGEGLGMP